MPFPSGAHGTAVAYACSRDVQFPPDVSSEVEQWRVHVSPVRLRHVTFWIAQLGRASETQSEGCGFDSRSENHDLSRHVQYRAQAQQVAPRGTRRTHRHRRCVTHAPQRRCRRHAALDVRACADGRIAMQRDADDMRRPPHRQRPLAAVATSCAHLHFSCSVAAPMALATWRPRARRSGAAISSTGPDHQSHTRRTCHVLDQAGRDRR